MAEANDFQQRIQRIGDLVQQLEGAADPAVRSAAKELIQSLMELHAAGLEKMLDIAFQAGDEGQRIIDDLGRDSLVSSLLVLYGLHPEPLENRVSQALERVEPQIRKHGGEVRVLGMEGGAVRLRIEVGAHSCGSTAKTLQTIVEQAIYEAAPDVASLTVDSADGKPASGFVALDALLASPATAVMEPARNSGD